MLESPLQARSIKPSSKKTQNTTPSSTKNTTYKLLTEDQMTERDVQVEKIKASLRPSNTNSHRRRPKSARTSKSVSFQKENIELKARIKDLEASQTKMTFKNRRPKSAGKNKYIPVKHSFDSSSSSSSSEDEYESIKKSTKAKKTSASWTPKKSKFKPTTPKPFSFSKESDQPKTSAFLLQKEAGRLQALEDAALAEARRIRSLKAKPPVGIIKRGEEDEARRRAAREAKAAQDAEDLKSIAMFHARDPPSFTTSSKNIEDQEQERKSRILKRAADNMAASKLPPRMQMSLESTTKKKTTRKSTGSNNNFTPKDVPNFSKLHSQWERALQDARTVGKTTVPQPFRAAESDKDSKILLSKKEREERKKAEVKLAERQQAEKAKRLYKAAVTAKSKSSKFIVKNTKSQELRSNVVKNQLAESQKKERQERKAEKERLIRARALGKEIAPEIKYMDAKRKEEYSGQFVELSDAISTRASAKARENAREFKAAYKANQDRLKKSLKDRPTLMQRFVVEKKTREHQKAALSSVVANVFGNDVNNIQDVFTPEEAELVSAIAASSNNDYDDDFE